MCVGPSMFSSSRQSHATGIRLIERSITQHREKHIRTTTRQSDQSLMMTLVLCSIAVIVCPGIRVMQSCQR